MEGHAAQQRVHLDRLGVPQVANTMTSSIPDHILDTAIWTFTAAEHVA